MGDRRTNTRDSARPHPAKTQLSHICFFGSDPFILREAALQHPKQQLGQQHQLPIRNGTHHLAAEDEDWVVETEGVGHRRTRRHPNGSDGIAWETEQD
ncbi:hypothetical protein MMC22_006820 [Lobaria immixta]|nr:hypothetical protein [Lobaria immixta]